MLFALYAVGLIPGCSSGRGVRSPRAARRRAAAGRPVAVATLLLIAFRHAPLGLGAAAPLAGVCSGVVFGAATAWVRELSAGARPASRRGARRPR